MGNIGSDIFIPRLAIFHYTYSSYSKSSLIVHLDLIAHWWTIREDSLYYNHSYSSISILVLKLEWGKFVCLVVRFVL